VNRNFEFDHVGIAVKSIAESEKFYKALGFSHGHEEIIAREKVKAKIFTLGNDSRVELLEPTSSDSVIAQFIEKRGQGIHHMCLRVKDIRKSLAELKCAGMRLVHETPFVGAENCLVAFVHPSSTGGVLIELSEPQIEPENESQEEK
jgi:methylmalonyl-CoA epimerase